MENSLENTSIGVLCGKIVSSRAANILNRDCEFIIFFETISKKCSE